MKYGEVLGKKGWTRFLRDFRFFDVNRWGEVEEGPMQRKADPVGPYNPEYRGDSLRFCATLNLRIDANPNWCKIQSGIKGK